MTTALSNSSYNNHSAGFTLIELMVTIAVLAIIVSIAVPSMSTQLANQRVKSTVATLENALKEAKAESIIRRHDVSVVYSDVTNTIVLVDAAGNVLSTYNINGSSVIDEDIDSNTATVTFQRNKVMADGASVVYTVCDNDANNETPRQVRLSSIANINTINGGTCS